MREKEGEQTSIDLNNERRECVQHIRIETKITSKQLKNLFEIQKFVNTDKRKNWETLNVEVLLILINLSDLFG